MKILFKKIWNIRISKRYKRKRYKLIDILLMTIYGILCASIAILELLDITNVHIAIDVLGIQDEVTKKSWRNWKNEFLFKLLCEHNKRK